MSASFATFVCRGCGIGVDPRAACPACGEDPPRKGSVIDFLGDGARDADASRVEAFYLEAPFPGYAPADDAASLLDRCRRSPFLVALDAAIPPDATVLDFGCGTGQLAAFLAIASPHRAVVGIDLCIASLACAAEFRARAKLDNLVLARADLFVAPLRQRAFDFVVSRGVVHHTRDPFLAIRRATSHVREGGAIVLGFYESLARSPHVARQWLARVAGAPLRVLDPVLRRTDLDEAKKRTWIADQYRHPLERLLALPDVIRVLEDEGFAWLRSVPPVPEGDMLEPTPRPGALALLARRLGFALRCAWDDDAGLVGVVARHQVRS